MRGSHVAHGGNYVYNSGKETLLLTKTSVFDACFYFFLAWFILAASTDLMIQKIFTFFFTSNSNCKSRAELGPLLCNQNITKNQLPKQPAAPEKNFSTQMETCKTWFCALHFWYRVSHWAFKSFLKFHWLILLLAALGLQCRMGFPLVAAWGSSLAVVCGLLTSVVPLVEHSL